MDYRTRDFFGVILFLLDTRNQGRCSKAATSSQNMNHHFSFIAKKNKAYKICLGTGCKTHKQPNIYEKTSLEHLGRRTKREFGKKSVKHTLIEYRGKRSVW